jgi:hypothetical protein
VPTGRPVDGGEMGLGGVLDDGEPVLRARHPRCGPSARVAVEVHRHDRGGPRGDRRLDGRGSRQKWSGSMSAKTGVRPVSATAFAVAAKLNDGTTPRRRPDPEREQREQQGTGARVHRDARPTADVRRELRLERRDLGPWASIPEASTRATAARSCLPICTARRGHLEEAASSSSTEDLMQRPSSVST